MERERITISIKKQLLRLVDKTIDGTDIRNRSHALETLITKALNVNDVNTAVVLIGGENAIKSIPAVSAGLLELAKNGFSEVYVAVGFLADEIKKKLGDGKDFGLKLHYAEEGEGTAGALFSLKKHLSQTFVVLNLPPKNISYDLSKILAFHKNHRGEATVATDDLSEMKGIYVFEPKILNQISKGFSMLEDDIFPKLMKENKLVVYPIAN